ncbi:MAG: helix-turn-helix domain-containing protein [Chitinispirillia bacterium]|nr:helix-turn-helix domain-containing protein [Chitinispirillia bacterium]
MSQSERIKKVRKHFEMTQADFGRKIGIVQGHLTGIERGRKCVTQKTIKVICATYGVSEEWLETGKGEMLDKNPEKKANGVLNVFNALSSEFQDYMLMQLKSLLTLQKGAGKRPK